MRRRIEIVGISLPWFGVTWQYREADEGIARRLVVHLEDSRVLFEPVNTQSFVAAGPSANDIREIITVEFGTANAGAELSDAMRTIWAAARRFMTDLDRIEQANLDPRQQRERQILALGEMRGRSNPVIAAIADKYKVEVEEELAAALEESAAAFEGNEG